MFGGTRAPTFSQIHRLTYVTQVLNEALRLWPTAPGFNRYAREDTVIGGRYRLSAGTSAMVMLPALHRDHSVWGSDADEYNPDHVAPDRGQLMLDRWSNAGALAGARVPFIPPVVSRAAARAVGR